MTARLRSSVVTILLMGIFTLMTGESSEACTSFVSYNSDLVYYGMNFDWHPELEIYFELSTSGATGATVFTMGFQGELPTPIRTVGMSGDGLFSSMQVFDTGEEVSTREPADGECYIYMPFYHYLWSCDSLQDVRGFLRENTLVQYPDPPLHLLLADVEGNAIIAEVGEGGNEILEIGSEGFLVMTNFPNQWFRDVGYDEVSGCGARRYIITWENMLERSASLSPSTGLGVLEDALNRSPGFPTRASMLFVPENGEVYVAIDSDLDHVWRFDLEDGIAEPWSEDAAGACGPAVPVGEGRSSLRASDMRAYAAIAGLGRN